MRDHPSRRERYFAGLDIGTSKSAAIVGKVVGLGVAHSRGIFRGTVVNTEAAADSIRKAIKEAEQAAGVAIDSVNVGPLCAAHIRLQRTRRGRGA